MYDFDHNLFLALNFDGGAWGDKIMLAISDTPIWIPLYLMILWLVWREDRWKGLLWFFLLMVGAIVLSDMVAGIFKANGLLGDLLPSFSPRWRPMFTPALEDLSITPDSLYILRGMTPEEQIAAGYTADWAVHVPIEAVTGRYGTVSAHASTVVALAVIASAAIRRKWFTWLMVFNTSIICYSRIYLAKHFPMDLVWGTLVGLLVGWGAWLIYKRLRQRWTRGHRMIY